MRFIGDKQNKRLFPTTVKQKRGIHHGITHQHVDSSKGDSAPYRTSVADTNQKENGTEDSDNCGFKDEKKERTLHNRKEVSDSQSGEQGKRGWDGMSNLRKNNG
jgi:hypothetical protein